MKRFIYACIFILLICSFTFAQDKNVEEEKTCPSVTISGPASITAPGDPQTFVLTIGGEYDEAKLKIKWEIDKGEIISGQGTKTLVISDKGLNNETIIVTAKVDAGGDCVITETEAVVFCYFPNPILIDEFGHINNEDLYARLDAYFVELQNNPGSQGYIIHYGKQRQISNREKLIKDYIKQRGYDLSRIVYVNGGVEKEIRTRMWLLPAGADASTID